MILHVMIIDKFLAPFIDFVDKQFGRGEHKYVFINDEEYKYGLEKRHNIEFLNSDDEVFVVLKKYMYEAKKIILHGLWRDRVDQLLYDNQDLLKKCYWIMWGGDFYFPETKSTIRHAVIKKMGHLITYIRGDYFLVQEWYDAKGEYHECFMYPSNLYKDYAIKLKKHITINIQLGNSADPTNMHIDLLEDLTIYKDANIKIFTPLSYGDQVYANKVIKRGKELFGEKFIALHSFMPIERYLEFLSNIDVAIFAHKIQQAMGNTIMLLGLNKKVYMRIERTPWKFFKEIDVKIFDLQDIGKDLLDINIKIENKQNIKKYFSENNLKIQMNKLLEIDILSYKNDL